MCLNRPRQQSENTLTRERVVISTVTNLLNIKHVSTVMVSTQLTFSSQHLTIVPDRDANMLHTLVLLICIYSEAFIRKKAPIKVCCQINVKIYDNSKKSFLDIL